VHSLSVVRFSPGSRKICISGEDVSNAAKAKSSCGDGVDRHSLARHEVSRSRESGAVLPILHVNGYKISNPTIFGSMSEDELSALFTGYGWQPRFVKGDDLSASMASAVDWALDEIREIQRAADVKKNPEHLRLMEDWLRSYRVVAL
jgi:phosphoketolase